MEILRRRKQPDPPDPLPTLMQTMAQRAMAAQYASGIKDGIRITLRLLLNDEAQADGVPYRGPMPDELRAWAGAALERLAATVLAVTVALLIASSPATAAPPRTSGPLFHVTPANLHMVEQKLHEALAMANISGGHGLDVAVTARPTGAAVNTRGLGYRHIRVTFRGVGPLSVTGTLLLTPQAGRVVYAGYIAVAGITSPLRGSLG